MCDHSAKYMLTGLISGTGPGTNPCRGAKLYGSEFRHVCY